MTVQDFIHQRRSEQIKAKAKELGFLSCGISRANFLEKEAPRLEKWLSENNQGTMQWMENHFDKRLDPRILVEGSRSIITVLLNYFPEEEINSPYKISKYAYGADYHYVIKDRLKHLQEFIEQIFGEINARIFVDSAPVMDKAWAERSGLGWIGKNSNLINPKMGSFFFIGEIILDLELWPDNSIKDYCGTCTKCIDACPTDAISEPYVVNGSKCISYLTIELKEAIPTEFKNMYDSWVFGCDICQDVCPWNRFSQPHQVNEFTPPEELKTLTQSDWENLSEESFKSIFKKSAIKRTKHAGLLRNIHFIKDLQDDGSHKPIDK